MKEIGEQELAGADHDGAAAIAADLEDREVVERDAPAVRRRAGAVGEPQRAGRGQRRERHSGRPGQKDAGGPPLTSISPPTSESASPGGTSRPLSITTGPGRRRESRRPRAPRR